MEKVREVGPKNYERIFGIEGEFLGTKCLS